MKQTDFDEQFSYADIQTVNIEKQEKAEVVIYPNPTQNQVSIIAAKAELENVKIYNVFGQEVTNNTTIVNQNSTQITVDMSSLNTGVYYVITKNSVNKVLKQ